MEITKNVVNKRKVAIALGIVLVIGFTILIINIYKMISMFGLLL